MAIETTYAGKIGDWQRLLEPIVANATDLSHLDGSRATLTNLTTQAVSLIKQQAAHRAAKQEQTVQLKSLIVEGQRLATVLRAAIKAHYGIRSEKLAEFGLKPFRGRARKESPLTPDGSGNPVTTPVPAVTKQLSENPGQ